MKHKAVFFIIFAFLLSASAALLLSCRDDSTASRQPAPIDGYDATLDFSAGTGRSETTPPSTDSTVTDPLETEPTTPKEVRYQFLCVGDNVGHDSVLADAKRRASDGGYSFLSMYDGIRASLDAADIRFINQETVMGGAKYGYVGYPNFNSPQQMGLDLITLGFDIVNIANNHMLDMREQGLRDTVDFWEAQDILTIGAYHNAEDYDNIRVFEYEDLRIAFLSYTYDPASTNGMTLNAGSDWVIPIINDEDMTRQVALAKEVGDLVFVSIHWGLDSSLAITEEQYRVAELLSELGVDAIIGHHSHTVQNMEWKTNANGHKTLVIYSLGNLLHSMYYSTYATPNYALLVGGMVTFDIVLGEDGWYLDSPLYEPIICHYTSDPTGNYHAANFNVMRLSDYNEELCAAHGAQVQLHFTYQDLINYVKKAVNAEFLPNCFK